MTTVLVVDDEESVRDTLRVVLERAGYTVLLAEDVAGALDRMASADPDVVVTDVILPGPSGMRLLETVHDTRPDTPVVVVTGEPNVDTAAQSVRLHAFDYLPKPLRKDAILSVVSRAAEFKRLVDRNRQLQEENLRYQHHLEEMVRDRTAELGRSEAKYRLLVENIPGVVWATDREGATSFIGHNVADVYGYTAEEVVAGGAPLWFGRIHPDDVQRVKDAFRDLFDHERTFDMEYRIQRRDGRWVWLHDQALRVEDIGGKRVAHGIFHDVTARRKADEELRNFFDLSQDFMVIIDLPRNGFRKMNDAAVRFFGRTPEEVLALPLGFSTLPQDVPKLQAALGSLMGERTTIDRVEIRHRRRDGAVRHIQWKGQLGPDRDAVYVVGRDITEEKDAEREMMLRLLRYRMEPGSVYLFTEQDPRHAMEAFEDVLKVGVSGTIISRTPRERFTRHIKGEYAHRWLTEQGGPDGLAPDAARLIALFKGLSSREVVLIDRLDYLVQCNGFDRTLNLIHNFKDLAILSGNILILCVDPGTISAEQLRLLEKECARVESIHATQISQELHDILAHIARQKAQNVRVSYDGLVAAMKISRPTARKRLGYLIQLGYLTEERVGKEKCFSLTDKGENLFS